MTAKEAEHRLDLLEKQLATRRDQPSYWQERLELLRVLDRARAAGDAPRETQG